MSTFESTLPSHFKYDAKVLRGKNGRYFLDNDVNHVIKQFTGELLFSDRQLSDWQLVLENRIAWLGKLGIPYFFMVPPNAHPVYPEDLPDSIRAGPLRPVPQLIQHLEDKGSFAQIVYPLDDLLAAKPNPLLYAKTDTHWTARGAFIAYRRLARAIGPAIPMHVVSEADVDFHDVDWMGELGYKLEPKEESATVVAAVRRPVARLAFDNCVWNRGEMVVTECKEAPPTSCLVFGDSFTRVMLTFLASSFRRLFFAFGSTLDYELVRQERPDVVISGMNERFLMTIPYDVGAPTTREVEREKKGDGTVREEIKLWPRADDP